MIDRDRLVLLLLNSALSDREFEWNKEFSWEEIFGELSVQTVAAVPADRIGGLGLSEEEMKQYTRYVAQHVWSWNRILYLQQTITDAFTDASIPSAVLKGTSAGIYYPKPEYRCMGDIDLIVLPEDFDRAAAVLEELGCCREAEMNERHDSYRKDGIHIELHHYFSTLQDPEMAGYLDAKIFEGVRNTRNAEMGGYHFPMLPKIENGLVLLQHICQHLESGLGLRQIMDWMLYVDAELTDDVWNDEFEEAAERIGLKNLAVIVTKMCQRYLGLTKNRRWCRDADSALCDRLMDYIMNHGNFGRKDRFANSAAPILNSMRRPMAFLRMLQKTGCKTWRLLERYPWLSPLAWVYQLIRWLRRWISEKGKWRALLRAVRKAGKEDDFLDQLGVRRVKNSCK